MLQQAVAETAAGQKSVQAARESEVSPSVINRCRQQAGE